MRRQTFVNAALLALALGTLGVVWLTREAPTTAELSARKNKLLPSFDKDAVKRLRLSQGERKLTLLRSKDADGGDFSIVEPWSERADVATVNQLLGALDLASSLRSAEGVSPEQAGLGQQALRIELEMAGKTAKIALGGAAPSPTGARYVQVTLEGGTHLYVVSQGVAAELGIELDKLRETRLLDYGKGEIAKLELQTPPGKVVLEQREHGAFFVNLEAGAELANRELTDRLLTALSRLTSEQFVEPEQARAAFKADKLVLKLDLFDRSVPPVTLTLGAGCPKAPELSLLLREQAGKPARAGCLPNDIVTALRVSTDELRLPGPFAARADEIEELKVARGGQKLDLARKDRAFVLRAPSRNDVALEAGNERIALILAARGERAPGASAASLGLEPPAGEVTVQVAGADEASHREEQLLLGKPRPDGSVCARRRLDAVVLCFDKSAARAFEPDASLLRSLALPSFAPSELKSVGIESKDLHELLRRNGDGSYQLEQPQGFVHDGSLVADAVQTLGALQAVRWVATSDDPSFGLAAPRLRVTVSLTAGAARELLVGAETSDGFFARLSPDPAIFVLPRVAFADLATPLVDRALCPLSKELLSQIELRQGARSSTLTRQGDAWQGSGVTAARAAELVETLDALRAEQAVHFGAARPAEGFAKPATTVVFSGKNAERHRLLLGARDTLGDSPVVYARRDDVDATFALSQRAAEDLQGF